MLKFLNDCAHILKAPHGNRLALFTGLMTNQKRLGFNVFHPDPGGISFLYREIFARQNYYFRAETDSPLIFDCGANIGMSTPYFKWLFPKSRIRCFEPDPYTYQTLNKNIANNRLELITTFQCALWDEEKKLDFFIDSKRPATTVMSAFPERGVTQAIEVSAEKLSKFITEPVDFLKLDVEGAETRVVQELVQSRKIALVKQMVIEYHHHFGTQRANLSHLLASLECAGFDYQLHSSLYPVTTKNVYQDVLIHAYL